MSVDYRHKVSMPIRDMESDGEIVFIVDIYGVRPHDLAVIPGGSMPMYRAVKRMGLDTERYRADLFDIPIRKRP